MACALLGSLLGTYLDLYFVGKGWYQFLGRPWPEIFSINLAFTLGVLPVAVVVFLYCMSLVNNWGKAGIILLASLLAPIMERFAEEIGLFVHSDQWVHLYSFFGYMLFLLMMTGFYYWLEKNRD